MPTGVDALILAADLTQAAIDVDTLAVDASLAGAADVPATAAIVAVEMRVDALVIADRAVVPAFTATTGTDLTRVTDVATGSTVTRIGIEADTFLTATGVVGKAAARVMGALSYFRSQREGARDLAAELFIVSMIIEFAAGTIALQKGVMCFSSASVSIAGGRLCHRWSDRSPHHNGGQATEEPLEDLAPRPCGTEHAR